MSEARAFIVTERGEVVSVDDGLLSRYALKQEDSRQIHEPFRGLAGIAEPRYDPEKLRGVLDLNTFHARACKTKARDTAGLGWVLTPRGIQPDAGTPEKRASLERKARLEAFFTEMPMVGDSFTHEITVQDVLYQAQLDYEGTGYGGLEIVREDAGVPRALVHIPSYTFRAHRDRKRFVQRRGSKKVWFARVGLEADVHKDTGDIHEKGTLPEADRATEIVWWRNYSPNDEIYGVPDFIPALGAIHGDLARRDFNLTFFSNYAVPAYAVTVTGDFDRGEPVDDEGKPDPKGKTPLERTIEQHFRHLRDHPHSNLVLTVPQRRGSGEKGAVQIKFDKLAIDVREASFRMYRVDNREEVLSSHGVPAGRVGVGEPGTAGREATEIYKRSVIEPRQRLIEGIVNRYIVRAGFGVQDWEFELFEIDNRDEAHEMTLLEGLARMRAVSAREVRRYFALRFGLDPEGEIPDEEGPDITAAELALKDLQRRLLEEVRRDGADGNGAADGGAHRDLLRALGGAQGSPGP